MTPRCTQTPAGDAARAAAAYRVPLPVIETARLVLRPPRIEDLADWTRIWRDAFAEPGQADEDAWVEFCIYTAGWLLHGHGLWRVTLKDGTPLGFVLLGLEWEDPEPELGWMLLPEHRRRGYATEAARAARDHATDLLGAGAFVSYVAPGNAPSNALAARLGARRDAGAEAALASRETIHVWRHGGGRA